METKVMIDLLFYDHYSIHKLRSKYLSWVLYRSQKFHATAVATAAVICGWKRQRWFHASSAAR
jgi:hypothetical protein